MRIVDALVELHQELGPKNTTIAAVAERAGVQRLTVYRHFPDEAAMLQACSGRWAAQNPPPQEAAWQNIRSAENRVQTALLAINDYYSRNHEMLAKVYRDASEVKPLAGIMDGFDTYFAHLADNLTAAIMNGGKNPTVRAVARHLVRFSTWQSMSREKLSNQEMARAGWIWLRRLSR